MSRCLLRELTVRRRRRRAGFRWRVCRPGGRRSPKADASPLFNLHSPLRVFQQSIILGTEAEKGDRDRFQGSEGGPGAPRARRGTDRQLEGATRLGRAPRSPRRPTLERERESGARVRNGGRHDAAARLPSNDNDRVRRRDVHASAPRALCNWILAAKAPAPLRRNRRWTRRRPRPRLMAP